MYGGQGITFDNEDWWSFNNDTDRNDIIAGVDNSSSSHSESRRNKFLILSY